jgi:hypothetical protein
MVIKKRQIELNMTLILNCHTKIKTIWGVMNKESRRNKKRSEIQALNIEGRKITDQQSIAETCNE